MNKSFDKLRVGDPGKSESTQQRIVKPVVDDKDLVPLHSKTSPEEIDAYGDFLYAKNGRIAVPMFLMEEAFKVYDKEDHNQPLQTIISRGGFSAYEIFHHLLSPAQVEDLYRTHSEAQQQELKPEVMRIATDLQGAAGVVESWHLFLKKYPPNVTDSMKANLVKELNDLIGRIEKHL